MRSATGDFRALLAQIIPARGMTQKQVATKIGMVDSQLSRIIHGTSNITCAQFFKLAKVLGIQPEALWRANNTNQVPELLSLGRAGDTQEFVQTDRSMQASERPQVRAGAKVRYLPFGEGEKPSAGDLVAVAVTGEDGLQVREYRTSLGKAMLVASNSDYPAVALDEATEVQLMGRVVAVSP